MSHPVLSRGRLHRGSGRVAVSAMSIVVLASMATPSVARASSRTAVARAAASPASEGAVLAGVVQAAAVTPGSARSWGLNLVGELGNGTTTSSTVPVSGKDTIL